MTIKILSSTEIIYAQFGFSFTIDSVRTATTQSFYILPYILVF